MNYNYMVTQSELLKIEAYTDITIIYRISQAVSVETLADGHKSCERAHRSSIDEFEVNCDGLFISLRSMCLPIAGFSPAVSAAQILL